MRAFMRWQCARCGTIYKDSFLGRWNCQNDSELRARSVPKEEFICWHCALYLLWSSIFPRGIRIYRDQVFLSGTNPALGKFSRHAPASRGFDIKYGFLNEATNLYWDECGEWNRSVWKNLKVILQFLKFGNKKLVDVGEFFDQLFL